MVSIGFADHDGNITVLEVPADITIEQEKALICERFNLTPNEIEWDADLIARKG